VADARAWVVAEGVKVPDKMLAIVGPPSVP
jgi:hypothetical protein